MAGTIPLSLTQQFDEYGKPLSGGVLYIYQAGTVATPQQPYQDLALTIVQPNPIPLDEAGRIPQFFLADGQIKIRLVDNAGIDQLVRDNVLVIGPSSGGGSAGPSVDPTTVLQTGMLALFYGTGGVAGFVRANGLSIGSASSGATERANSDCLALFQFLWGADPNLAVSGGRGASAAADWSDNKQITLPDWRGRAIAGLDDMGNSAAGRLTGFYFGNGTVLGAAGGFESHTLLTGQIPSHGHGVTITDPGHVHSNAATAPVVIGNVAGGAVPLTAVNGRQNTSSNPTGLEVSIQNAGGGGPHHNVQPTMLTTIYLKL